MVLGIERSQSRNIVVVNGIVYTQASVITSSIPSICQIAMFYVNEFNKLDHKMI